MGEENGELPDDLRCRRTDGRQWRCNRRVMQDKKLCEVHHLQGKHRQCKTKVPESLKLERRNPKTSRNSDSAPVKDGDRIRGQLKKKKKKRSMMNAGIVISTENGSGSVKKMKLKKGDLETELIRMVLKREVEKRKTTNNKNLQQQEERVVERESSGVDCPGDDGGSSGGEEEEGEELMRALPYGVMAISPVKNYDNAASSSSSDSFGNSGCDAKINGGAELAGSFVSRRRFRSKNLQPMPVGATLQVTPCKKETALRKGKKKRKCHWCRRSGVRTSLIRCSSCRKEFYCYNCIRNQYYNVEEEIKMACPVCRGTCGCKICSETKTGNIKCKDLSKDKSNVNKVLHYHYLICMLLPLLKQMNQDQRVELEIEAKLKGKKPSDIKVQLAEGSSTKLCHCNNCRTSIVDFHRSCPNCSYKLCLSCCRDIFQGSLPGSVKTLIWKNSNGRKTCIPGKQLSEMKAIFVAKQKSGRKYDGSTRLLRSCRASESNAGISCPRIEFGGCGDSVLALSCLFPLSWTKELETSAEELVGCYDLPETLDDSSHCSLCNGINCDVNGIEQLQEAARREDSLDNFLYYPTASDIRVDNFEHFQKHWRRGQPVVVRKVVKDTAELSWDPLVIFCTFLKNNITKAENNEAINCLDWFEVEIGVRQLFMGSFKGQTHANSWNEKLKLKGWLSSDLLQEHFPGHYAEIIRALPLPEYMNPVSGIWNIASELPEKVLKPDLGPCIYISYGSGENLGLADCLTKLRYDSYDMVNILVHATDDPVSAEQINYVRKLLKKHKQQHEVGIDMLLDEKNMEEVGLGDFVQEEIHLPKKIARASWFSASMHNAQASSKERNILSNDDSNSDSDSDTNTDTDDEVSKFFFGPIKSSRSSKSHEFCKIRPENSNHSEWYILDESCAAQWDVFRRQDVPKLLEYLKRHARGFTHTHGFQSHVVHPILDQNFFLDATHKLRLKEEFKIEPWTFVQHVGEAVIIPAGCPYQIRNLKSCVNVVLDFVSPEQAPHCIKTIEELSLLPYNHKAKLDCFEVKKMALYTLSRAVKQIRELTCAETSVEHHN